MTRLQPPFFSTGLPHLGQGLVCAVSQFFVSLSSAHFSRHSRHLRAHACSRHALIHAAPDCRPSVRRTSNPRTTCEPCKLLTNFQPIRESRAICFIK